ncbi:MAG: GAF domain-containing protein [candidate division Zixibacteria bacterium]|nr:GAF domain-containing protein [candidate division Zixibacteria bacterium]
MIDAHRRQLVDRIAAAIASKPTRDDVLRAAVELIAEFSDRFDWTGFYMLEGEILVVGPYVGPPTPHTRIELNRGICGAAATQQKTIIVDDVHTDPRFLACSITTRSEIVVPLMDGDRCIGEIDIDSNRPAAFTSEDREMLEAVAKVIVSRLHQV